MRSRRSVTPSHHLLFGPRYAGNLVDPAPPGRAGGARTPETRLYEDAPQRFGPFIGRDRG